MKLSEIFSQLTYGEFAQLRIGGVANSGEISETNYDSVLSHINLGLTSLYKRFPLKEGRITVALQAGRSSYPLTLPYALSNTKSKQPIRYILDTAESFLDDILKVEGVFTDAGHEFGLNDAADTYAVMTPSANTLRVHPSVVAKAADIPEYLRTSNLLVVYRANHPIIKVGMGFFDPAQVDVELPYSHLEPLLYFVASRVHSPIGLVTEFNVSNSYAAKYEQSCQQLETFNLKVDQGSQPDRLHQKGWV